MCGSRCRDRVRIGRVKTLSVGLAERTYPIHIGAGLLADGDLLRAALGPGSVVVTDTNVGPLYLDTVRAAGREQVLAAVEIPAGEQHKTLASIERIIDVLTRHECGRDTTLIALGGGVIGDMTGFAAAIYQRGVAFVQLPTTLLAQVDAAVGGKTAVNHPRGKNLIGAFHQPRCVISDTATLATLAPREFRAGLAEVIKHALLADPGFFAWLEREMGALLNLDRVALDHAIARCCEIKAAIVARDERETGVRALLNLGHTFGHAIESATGYEWLHGEAVATGLVMAAKLSVELGSLDAEQAQRVERLVATARLPTAPPDVGNAELRRWMRLDKKALGGRLRFVVLDRIGAARLESAVPEHALEAVLKGRAGPAT